MRKPSCVQVSAKALDLCFVHVHAPHFDRVYDREVADFRVSQVDCILPIVGIEAHETLQDDQKLTVALRIGPLPTTRFGFEPSPRGCSLRRPRGSSRRAIVPVSPGGRGAVRALHLRSHVRPQEAPPAREMLRRMPRSGLAQRLPQRPWALRTCEPRPSGRPCILRRQWRLRQRPAACRLGRVASWAWLRSVRSGDCSYGPAREWFLATYLGLEYSTPRIRSLLDGARLNLAKSPSVGTHPDSEGVTSTSHVTPTERHYGLGRGLDIWANQPMAVTSRNATVRDFAIFQVKLALDGMNDLVAFNLSIVAPILRFHFWTGSQASLVLLGGAGESPL